MLLNPLQQRMRIQTEDHRIRLPYQLRIKAYRALIDQSCLQRVVDAVRIDIQRADMKAFFLQSLSVTASQQSQTDD